MQGILHLVKVSKNMGVLNIFKAMAGEIFCVARHSTEDMFIRDVRKLAGQGADFLRAVAFISVQQIYKFAQMTLRDRCSTLCDQASLFRVRRSTLDRKSREHSGTRPSALHSTLSLKEFSHNCLFLMLKVKMEAWSVKSAKLIRSEDSQEPF